MYPSLINFCRIAVFLAIGLLSAPLMAAQQPADAVEFHTALPTWAIERCRRELKGLHARLQHELGARSLSRPVKVYVYAHVNHYVTAVRELGIEPGGRPALFLKRNNQSFIFTHATGDYLPRLRHEFTHAVLHDSFAAPPLWLDEGLAEHYEAVDDSGSQPVYERLLATQLPFVWKPSPRRMAQWRKMEDMRMLEYAEAWSWAHLFMQSPRGREHIRFWLANPSRAKWTQTLKQATDAWETRYGQNAVARR